MSPSKPRRPFGLGMYLLLLVGVGVIALMSGVIGGTIQNLTGASSFWVTAASLGAAMAAGVGLSLLWWRNIDEAAREAHKWAWWWGGSGGMAVGAALLLSLSMSEDAPVKLAGAAPDDLIAGGMVTILLFQLAGYLIAWAFWWLRHR